MPQSRARHSGAADIREDLAARLPVKRGQITQVDLLAFNSQEMTASYDGSISMLRCIVQKVPTVGGTIGVKINTVTVIGMVCTIASAAAKGSRTNSAATTPGSTTTRVAKGDRIEIVPAGFATAGEVNWQLEFNPDSV